MILDTSFLIDLLRSKSAAVEELNELEGGDKIVSLTPVNAFELHYGAKKHGKEEELKSIEILFRSMEVIEIKWGDGIRAAEIQIDLESRGEMIEFLDALTGAVALRRNEAVLTRNSRHFNRIEGLEVDTY